jgi:lincosamide nucleotidyltransferase A/C/D/E
MEAGDVLRVYDRLEDLGIESWIEGGWDLDALLERQTRPHEDLDLVVRVADVPRLLDALAEHGFRHVRGELTPISSSATSRGGRSTSTRSDSTITGTGSSAS